MNTMQEALNRAGIVAGDFRENEAMKFSIFPLITKWRPILSEKHLDDYKYQRQRRSDPLLKWMDTQDDQNSKVINFLRQNKERVYIFPAFECQKYLECWIGYSSKYQLFTIRVNNLAQTVCPFGGITNPYASKLVAAMRKHLAKWIRYDEQELDKLTFADVLNYISAEDIPNIIRKSFEIGIIPVEEFDPIVEINKMVSANIIAVESADLDDIRKQLAELETSNRTLTDTKLHKNVIDLYCRFNYLKILDPYHVQEKKNWLNLVVAKDPNSQENSFITVI